jgi:hypothetical protein
MGSEGGSFAALLAKMAEIIETSRSTLPAWLADLLPRDGRRCANRASHWLREHSAELQLIGKETGHILAHVLIGMVIGGMVSLREANLRRVGRWRWLWPNESFAWARPSGGRLRPGAHLGTEHPVHCALSGRRCCPCSVSTCRSPRR